MKNHSYQKLIKELNDVVEPLGNDDTHYDSLLDKVGDARFVLIGESTHGTHEFYQRRIEITQKLIEEKGFMAVAIEGDWPDAHQIHRYVQGDVDSPEEGLSEFTRFPTWMWRNTTLPPFLKWLRQYNDQLPSKKVKIGFFGLDLYSLNASMKAVIDYLKKVDNDAAERAVKRYSCFDRFDADPQTYGYLTHLGIKKECINEAVEQLIELQHRAFEYQKNNHLRAEDAHFFATQNARLVRDAEKYYRSMFEGQESSWNIRDTHMADTVDVLSDHLENRFQKPAKIVIWAHNSHVGDARATEMGERGEINIGQLMRERHDENAFNIGFSTYKGEVSAASNWDAPVERKTIVPGLEGSFEALFHEVKYDHFLLDTTGHSHLERYLMIPRLQRAIGVIYRPETERVSHYFFTRLPYQFDCMIHLDKTTALKPLDINQEWEETNDD